MRNARNVTAFLLLMTLLCLAVGSLQPFDLSGALGWPGWHQSPPSDFVWNIAAYAPLGACLCLLLGNRLVGFAAAILLAATASLLLESAQSMSPSRVSSCVDVMANGLGAATGAGLAALLPRLPKLRH